MDVTLRERNRLFAALDLPDDLRELLGDWAGRIAGALGGRAVPAESLHVTLDFLGRVPADAGPALAAGLHGAAAALGAAPMRAGVTGVRARPSAGRARLCAADLVDHDGAMAALAGGVRDAMARALGRPSDARAFWPHVTLVRFSRPARVSRDALPAAGADAERVFDFRRAALYDSEVSPGRPPRYRALVKVPVGGA